MGSKDAWMELEYMTVGLQFGLLIKLLDIVKNLTCRSEREEKCYL